jgi:DNA helicase-2/ATP-dependent DNA helicase PcrA
MTDLLTGLNEPQKAAVTAEPGPILVLAGPGSGKTRVLTHRIAYLIEAFTVAPWQIMAVTFTNKAAREMQARVERLLGGRLRGLTIGTFHATCARILRREAEYLADYDRDFVIFDTDDQRQLVRRTLAELNLDEKKFQPNRMLNGISSAKNELITAEEYQATNYISEITRRVYSRYQELLIENNAMDFDDLLMNTVQMFDDRPDVLARYQERYQHVLVDEFQDTNTTQYTLLRRLVATHEHLFAVGDSDQSIYKWRGADFRNIQRFRRHYPDTTLILLEQNYRSTQVILDAAKAVIRQNMDRVDKDLFTERGGGEAIIVREAYDEREEADLVVSTIQQLILNGYNGRDCAVMYRTNAQSRVLEDAFIQVGMPYKLVGATKFYGRREIKDLIAYLRVIHNPADSVSFSRIINTPTRGIGKKTKETLYQWAESHGWQPAEALVNLVSNPDLPHSFSGRALNALTRLGNMLRGWLTVRDDATIVELFDLVVQQTDFQSYLDDGTDEGLDRWENVMELRNVAALAGDADLSDFLEQVALVSDVDNLEEEENAPTLLTLHAAKGLEFPIVFITGVEDGVLPHSRTLDDMEEVAEERRLFYVGLTRAKDRLYLFNAFRRTFFGMSEPAIPSRFLDDIPLHLTSGDTAGQRREQTKQKASSWQWDATPSSFTRTVRQPEKRPRSRPVSSSNQRARSQPPPKPASPPPPRTQFQTGQKVRHAKFGEGIVIESKSTGNDEEVTIAFRNEGIKKLAASFANLETV